MKKKTGRKQIEIDQKEFEKLCGLFCTLEEIAGWFDCSADTIERWCKRTYNERFAEIIKSKAGRTKASLRRKQIELALTGDKVMLIWLGKQHLDQRDKHDTEIKTEAIQINIDATDAKA